MLANRRWWAKSRVTKMSLCARSEHASSRGAALPCGAGARRPQRACCEGGFFVAGDVGAERVRCCCAETRASKVLRRFQPLLILLLAQGLGELLYREVVPAGLGRGWWTYARALFDDFGNQEQAVVRRPARSRWLSLALVGFTDGVVTQAQGAISLDWWTTGWCQRASMPEVSTARICFDNAKRNHSIGCSMRSLAQSFGQLKPCQIERCELTSSELKVMGDS